MSEENKFAIIVTGHDVDFRIYMVNAEDTKEALIKYCEWSGELNDVKMEAVRAVCFDSAVILANEWLEDPVVQIHKVEDIMFSLKRKDGSNYFEVF